MLVIFIYTILRKSLANAKNNSISQAFLNCSKITCCFLQHHLTDFRERLDAANAVVHFLHLMNTGGP